MANTTLKSLADKIGADLDISYHDVVIKSIAAIDCAGATELTFFENKKLLPLLTKTKAAAVIISPEHAELYNGCKLVVKNPRYALAKLSHIFAYENNCQGIHKSAVIDDSAKVHKSATIGANCVIGKGVVINENVVVGANSTIEDYVTIDTDTVLSPNVTVMHHCQIGSRCIIASGAVVGSDGFGYAFNNSWHKIAHIGVVKICDDVEIGANTTIDRGTFGKTIIHNGVKLDNQIQIGHNVEIKEHTIIAGCTGIAGSTVIGRYCRIGGGVKINGHIEIADKVVVAGSSAVISSITEPGSVYSSALDAQPSFVWNRNQAIYRKLYSIIKSIKTPEV